MAAKRSMCVCFAVIFISSVLVSGAESFTDPLDVTALHHFYRALNNPPVLKGWQSDGGDPCEESWDGVSCAGSSVIYLKLHSLNLFGYIPEQLYTLFNLKHLDVSSNNIVGAIPNALPPNATHINLACNNLVENIPFSLPLGLQYLNLSHNLLSGPVGDAFTGLWNLRQLDLSYNKFTGDLPSSIATLRNLNGLNVSHNMLSGPVGDVLAGLENLREVDLSKNYFTGDDQNPSDAKLLPSQIILYHRVQDDLSQQRPNHFRPILIVGVVVGLGVLIYLSGQAPNHGKRKEPGDDDSKRHELPRKHQFVNPKVKDLRPAPFLEPGFRPANYLTIEDGKARESVDAAALRRKKGEGSSAVRLAHLDPKNEDNGDQENENNND